MREPHYILDINRNEDQQKHIAERTEIMQMHAIYAETEAFRRKRTIRGNENIPITVEEEIERRNAYLYTLQNYTRRNWQFMKSEMIREANIFNIDCTIDSTIDRSAIYLFFRNRPAIALMNDIVWRSYSYICTANILKIRIKAKSDEIRYSRLYENIIELVIKEDCRTDDANIQQQRLSQLMFTLWSVRVQLYCIPTTGAHLSNLLEKYIAESKITSYQITNISCFYQIYKQYPIRSFAFPNIYYEAIYNEHVQKISNRRTKLKMISNHKFLFYAFQLLSATYYLHTVYLYDANMQRQEKESRLHYVVRRTATTIFPKTAADWFFYSRENYMIRLMFNIEAEILTLAGVIIYSISSFIFEHFKSIPWYETLSLILSLSYFGYHLIFLPVMISRKINQANIQAREAWRAEQGRRIA